MILQTEVNKNENNYFCTFNYDSLASGVEFAHRVSMATLPVMLYYSFYPAWMALSTINAVHSTKRLYTALGAFYSNEKFENKEVGIKEISYHLFKTASSVSILALSVILFPVGLCIASVVGIIEDVINITHYTIYDYKPEKIALSFIKLVGHTATFAGTTLGNLPLALLGSTIGLCTLLHSIHREFSKDKPRALESMSFTAQALLKTQGIMAKINRLSISTIRLR